MSAKDCAIILLASGLSKRFGAEDKLLARLAGQSVIDHTLGNIAPVGFGLHIAVIGALANTESALSDKLKTAGYQIIVNPHPCLLYTSPSPRDGLLSRMPSSA